MASRNATHDRPPAFTASRSSWAGQLEIGPHTFPIKAYAAAVAAAASSLHLVHQGCGERLQLRKYCPVHGEVEAASVAKAFCYAPEEQFELSPDELDSLRCAEDKTLHLDYLLPAAQMDLALLSGRSLYLAPAHVAAEPAYALLTQVLGANMWAIGKGLLSDQHQPVAVHVAGGRLLLHVLHWPQQRRACPYVDRPAVSAGRAEVRAFEKSLAKLRRSFRWDEYRDDYPQKLAALIQEKLAARSQIKLPSGRRSQAARTLTAAAPRRARAA